MEGSEIRGEQQQLLATPIFTPPTAPPVEESKPGYKTTEFWVTLATALGLLVNVLPAPQSKEGLYAVIVTGLYALSRGLAKLGVPNIVAAFAGGGAEGELPGGVTDAQRLAG